MNYGILDILFVGAGGAVGSIARYLLESMKFSIHSVNATVMTNLIGCFFIGVIYTVLQRVCAPQYLYRFLVTGLLGGFTTFSAFALQPILMVRSNELANSCLYIVITVFGGILLCFIGLWFTDKVFNALV